MNAPLPVRLTPSCSKRKSARSRRSSPDEWQATLQIGHHRMWLTAQIHQQYSWSLETLKNPIECLRDALTSLQKTMSDSPTSVPAQGAVVAKQLMQVRWRLVLNGGFYHLSARPKGKWTQRLGESMAGELESDCPVSLDELTVATLPIGPASVWTAALPNKILAQWHQAATELGLVLEGIWTAPSALVEYLLEYPIVEPLIWNDGQTEVMATPFSEAATGAPGDPLGLTAVRVKAVRGKPSYTGPLFEAGTEDIEDAEAPPPEFLPCYWAHKLQRVDSSESLNLARNRFIAPDLLRRRRRTMVHACWWVTCGVTLLAIAMLLYGYGRKERTVAHAAELNKLWKSSQGAVPQPPLVVDTLQRQINAWKNLNERGLLGRRRADQLVLLSRWIEAIPPAVAVNINHIRSSGSEIFLDGQVKSQADARLIFDALAKIPGLVTESARTSAAQGNLVGFSIRLSVSPLQMN